MTRKRKKPRAAEKPKAPETHPPAEPPSVPEETGVARRCRRLTLAVFVAGSLMMGATILSSGVVWDECYYLSFARKYAVWFNAVFGGTSPALEPGTPEAQARWFRAVYDAPFSGPILRSVWGLDRQTPDRATLGQKHPPLGKFLSCCAWMLYGGRLGMMLSARLVSAALFGLLCAATFAFAFQHWDEPAAWFSVAALALMPRFHAHMRVASLEPVLVVTSTLTVFAFPGSLKTRWGFVGCGILFGLALLSKINAAFLPLMLAPWALWFYRKRALAPLVLMGVIGLVVFLVGWPAFWPGPVQGLKLYLADKLERWPIPTFYFGAVYRDPTAPWHFPWVMLFITTPLLVPAAATIGAVRGVRRKGRLEILLLWAALFPVLLATVLGGRYDGARLFLSACPFLALLAGTGAAWAWRRVRERRGRRLAGVLTGIAAAWMLLPMVLLHPFQMAYYNELIGGPWGARAAGMETTYWFDTFGLDAVDFLCREESVPKNGSIAFVPSEDAIWKTYQADGYAREDIRLCHFTENWDYLVVIPRRSFYPDGLDQFLASHQPVWQRYLTPFKKIPVCRIFRRETGSP